MQPQSIKTHRRESTNNNKIFINDYLCSYKQQLLEDAKN